MDISIFSWQKKLFAKRGLIFFSVEKCNPLNSHINLKKEDDLRNKLIDVKLFFLKITSSPCTLQSKSEGQMQDFSQGLWDVNCNFSQNASIKLIVNQLMPRWSCISSINYF